MVAVERGHLTASQDGDEILAEHPAGTRNEDLHARAPLMRGP